MMKVGILICSCDFYKDCWRPIIYSFEKYWNDCLYTKYIISNHVSEELPDTVFIKVGDHKGWGSDTLNAISKINCEYLIYFQEDYFLSKFVDNSAIVSHVNYCVKNGVDYLKISNDTMFRDNYRIGKTDYCLNNPTIRYSIDTAVAIWKKDLLMKLAIPGFTGWDFERKIIPYIKNNNIELKSEILHSSVMSKKGISLISGNAIQRGMWTKSGVKFLKENGFNDLTKKRKHVGKIYTFISFISPKNRYLRIPFWMVLKLLRGLHLMGV